MPVFVCMNYFCWSNLIYFFRSIYCRLSLFVHLFCSVSYFSISRCSLFRLLSENPTFCSCRLLFDYFIAIFTDNILLLIRSSSFVLDGKRQFYEQTFEFLFLATLNNLFSLFHQNMENSILDVHTMIASHPINSFS